MGEHRKKLDARLASTVDEAWGELNLTLER
jgi:hypothetical protein